MYVCALTLSERHRCANVQHGSYHESSEYTYTTCHVQHEPFASYNMWKPMLEWHTLVGLTSANRINAPALDSGNGSEPRPAGPPHTAGAGLQSQAELPPMPSPSTSGPDFFYLIYWKYVSDSDLADATRASEVSRGPFTDVGTGQLKCFQSLLDVYAPSFTPKSGTLHKQEWDFWWGKPIWPSVLRCTESRPTQQHS